MKGKLILMAIVITGSLLSCNEASQGKKSKKNSKEITEIIGRTVPEIKDGIMTPPEVLYSFVRVGSVEVSPDKSHIIYQVSYVSIPQNKTNSELVIMKSDGSEKKQLTFTSDQESNPQWIDNGKKIAFLSDETGSSQIWIINPDGGGVKQISDVDGGINGFAFSPDGKKVLFVKDVKITETAADKYPDLPKASGRVVDDLMYKHWDKWVESVPHPFVADLAENKFSNIKDLLEGGNPTKLLWILLAEWNNWTGAPTSKTIAYTSRKNRKAYSLSTNSDIFSTM